MIGYKIFANLPSKFDKNNDTERLWQGLVMIWVVVLSGGWKKWGGYYCDEPIGLYGVFFAGESGAECLARQKPLAHRWIWGKWLFMLVR